MIPEFADKHILIVEDEFFLDEETRAVLVQSVAGLSVMAAADAMRILDGAERFDGAILDINLAPERAFALVEQLEACGVPFLFAFAGLPLAANPVSTFRLCSDETELSAIAKLLFTNVQLH